MGADHAKHFKFNRLDNIGAPDAEMDSEFLDHCFVDNGDIGVLEDPKDRRVIVLGRTGTGKSALFHLLKTRQSGQVITVKPESLALTHIANSQILKFVSTLGINLDPLFKLLWRHVFTVELLRRFFEQHSSGTEPLSLIQQLQALFSSSAKESRECTQAIQYLRNWGEKFWEDTEYRVREITSTIETKIDDSIKASLGEGIAALSLGSATAKNLSESQKTEVINRTQQVISQAQVQDLTNVETVLDRVLSNRQHPYFILVDQLDENWIEENLRYRLIRALILTAREFIKTNNAKIVLAIRRDLIDRVFRITRDSGFQEEKYAGSYLPLSWTRPQIIEVLDKRVRYLISRRYTNKPVTFKDVLPDMYDSKPIDQFIFEVSKKPRDVIALFNSCIQASVDDPVIGTREFSIALGEYSRGRIRALADEWQSDYPHLVEYASILNGCPKSFKLGSITDEKLVDLCLSVASEFPERKGILHSLAHAVAENEIPIETFRMSFWHSLYKVGLIGLKVSADSKASWVDDTGQSVSRGQLEVNTSIVVHPTFHRCLGIIAN